ncbi:MAG TPA: EAL domain-containing protein [Polyangiales bacterium]|jgi:EAL domain-containing protein (putative c-di-GMP-specific phosphodiesterase class I)|nr:EAL domain-containing protein [Polyangiales bacterium]
MSLKPQNHSVEGVWAPRASLVPSADSPSGPRPVTLARWSEEATADDSGEVMIGCVPRSNLGVVYQPIVDLTNGRSFAYEVLARCKVPGLTNPSILFKRAAAERFCGSLGRELRRLGSEGCRGTPLFLNVHPAELSDRFVIQPDDPMYAHDDDVYVEITESVPFSHYDLCSSMLKEIRARGGVHLVVDDLGAGYSNLKRIADLHPAVVKLDRELVTNLNQNRRQRVLVKAVVQMCIDLEAKIVAEGLETWDEVRAVRDCGCHFGQGYVLGRPANTAVPPIWKL